MASTGSLAYRIWVAKDDGELVEFQAGDTLPAWAAKKVDNPGAFVDDGTSADQTEDETGAPPPRSGRGSGVDAWRAYAAAHDVDVDDDATREDVIDALDAAGVPTE
ncbi:hypothetical protein QWY28_17340 [Nocardioides sp. SOB77]|uniref:Lsr2 family protein n=1 Tax=Nocardioides oceani TaxID=3058369 RepID=A0ABT8FJM8_9ACTN|nr:hypothetical protein [Nocardioides oceani]MDN4174729.1 hypothetical protein [Nocardioides oceani]